MEDDRGKLHLVQRSHNENLNPEVGLAFLFTTQKRESSPASPFNNRHPGSWETNHHKQKQFVSKTHQNSTYHQGEEDVGSGSNRATSNPQKEQEQLPSRFQRNPSQQALENANQHQQEVYQGSHLKQDNHRKNIQILRTQLSSSQQKKFSMTKGMGFRNQNIPQENRSKIPAMPVERQTMYGSRPLYSKQGKRAITQSPLGIPSESHQPLAESNSNAIQDMKMKYQANSRGTSNIRASQNNQIIAQNHQQNLQISEDRTTGQGYMKSLKGMRTNTANTSFKPYTSASGFYDNSKQSQQNNLAGASNHNQRKFILGPLQPYAFNKNQRNPVDIQKPQTNQIGKLSRHYSQPEDEGPSGDTSPILNQMSYKRRGPSQQMRRTAAGIPQSQQNHFSTQDSNLPKPRALQEEKSGGVFVSEYEDLDFVAINKYRQGGGVASMLQPSEYRGNTDQSHGIRIKINRESKVVNHLNSEHQNTNLLFYDFNAYKQTEGGNPAGERVPTRNAKSRAELRQRQIQSANQSHHPQLFISDSKLTNHNADPSQSPDSTATNSIQQDASSVTKKGFSSKKATEAFNSQKHTVEGSQSPTEHDQSNESQPISKFGRLTMINMYTRGRGFDHGIEEETSSEGEEVL